MGWGKRILFVSTPPCQFLTPLKIFQFKGLHMKAWWLSSGFCSSEFVHMILPENATPDHITLAWVHPGFYIGGRTFFRYEISQQYHVNEEPLASTRWTERYMCRFLKSKMVSSFSELLSHKERAISHRLRPDCSHQRFQLKHGFLYGF